MCHKKQEFVHLHCHTNYSIQDALPSPYGLVTAADEMGFPAIAMTDHGRMSGTVEFVDAARKSANGIKPIIGVEVYVCKDRLFKSGKRTKNNHLTLLAKNEEGYRNLLKVCSVASSEGFWYAPRVDHSVLEKHSKGIIALSGCLASEVNQALLEDDYQKAIESAAWLRDIYTDGFFMELHYHGIEEQKHNLPGLIKIGKELNVPLVCSNDVHYIQKQDWSTHDVLLQMRDMREQKESYRPGATTGKRKAYETKQFYLKTQAQMEKIFGGKVPEAVTNTMVINEMIEDYFVLDAPHSLPEAKIPTNNTVFNTFKESKLPNHAINDAYLAYLAFEGLKKRGRDKNKPYVSRLKKELSQIWYTGVTDYFLICNEIVKFMKDADIIYGIRGSGVGSLVNYCLEVHSVDPIRWGLLFERFLNPGRGTQFDLILSDDKPEDTHGLTNIEATKRLKEIAQDKMSDNALYKKHLFDISRELWAIENQDLSGYYLSLYESNTTYDKNNANSWFAYCMGLTSVKPSGALKVKRTAELPDIDIDVDDAKRPILIEWVRERFGHDKVANISAWGTYGAKAAVKGALKTSEKFNAKYPENPDKRATDITKTIPNRPGTTVDSALAESQDFAYWSSKFPDEIHSARELFGVISNLSLHAAGVVISAEPVDTLAPLENSKGTICSGYEWESASRVGLVKYDLLGLKTYRMLDIARRLVKERHGVTVDFLSMDFEDTEVYKLFKKGQTSTVFQFGSPGMRDALKLVKASDMEDLIAVVSLYRPGPLEYIPSYAKRKLGKEEYSFSHPIMEKHLGYTYGILVYQEQAMKLARELAGFSWTEVDKLRKAISKKSSKDFNIMLKLFKEKGMKNGISERVCDEAIQLMEKFGGYAFNRSHAASYAILAYWTAYMRWYYPSEWLAACIEVDFNDDDALCTYILEASECNLDVHYPDVNVSDMTVTLDKIGDVWLPLTACKGCGELAKDIAENKPYDSFEDLVNRAMPHKTVMKALVSGNALKSLPDVKNLDFEEVMSLYDVLIKEARKTKKVKTRLDQKSLLKKQEPEKRVKNESSADKFFEDFE